MAGAVKRRTEDTETDMKGPFAKIEGDVGMKTKSLKVTRGSGNVFRDLGHENADIEQFKAILAAEIIKALDREGLSVRGAHGRTGTAAADFSRIRNADLGRFTVDRLMSIINRLGSRVEVKVKVRRVEAELSGHFGRKAACDSRDGFSCSHQSLQPFQSSQVLSTHLDSGISTRIRSGALHDRLFRARDGSIRQTLVRPSLPGCESCGKSGRAMRRNPLIAFSAACWQ